MADDHGEEKIGDSKKKNAGEDMEEQELLHNHLSSKVEMHTVYDPAIPLQVYVLEKLLTVCTHRDM